MSFKNAKEFMDEKNYSYLLQKIIGLKQANRNISDKVKSFEAHLDNNSRKCIKFYIDGRGDCSYVYHKRINRDINTVTYLKRLQEYNSLSINIYRKKIKVLKGGSK